MDMAPGPHRRSREGARLVGQPRLGRGVMRPFFLAPTLTRQTVPDVGPVARNTSSRLITIFTGRPARCDSSTATGSR